MMSQPGDSKDRTHQMTTRSSREETPESPASSHASMTTGTPTKRKRDSPSHKVRPDSPAPSCVSMKSDRSMEPPIDLKERGTSPTIGTQQKRPRLHHELSSVLREVECKAKEFLTNELKRLTSYLTEDFPESPCSEEDEEHQREARDGALKIAVHILRNMNQEVLAQQLEKYGLVPRCQQNLKVRLKEKFQKVFEGVAKQGQPARLEDIYTELYITEGESVEVNTEHEVRQIEMASRRQITKRETPIKCTDIFKPLPGQDNPIRTVLTKGVAGIGKTVSVQKFILDWAEEKANQDVTFILPLPFRELNVIKDKTLSLMNVIHLFFPELKRLTFSDEDKSKIVFILDGLDESRLPLHFQTNDYICDVTEPASVDVLLTNLIKGNLLPTVLVWITSRPSAANQIPSECVDQVTEVRGFNDPQKEEYFMKRITKEKLAIRIITHLKSSRTLYIMCHIPVFCWMSSTVLEYILTEAESGEIPKSLTQMYTHFLIIQTRHISLKYGNRDADALLETLLSLGKLAFQQLEKGNVIFYEEDLRECGIDVTEASVYSGVCTQIFREEAGLYQGKVFCFVHLSIQEYLASLYVFVCFNRRETNAPDHSHAALLSVLFGSTTVQDLQKTAVDLALQSPTGHWDLFVRFLLGLSVESSQNLLRDLLPNTVCSPSSTEGTVTCIKQKIREAPNPERCINLFHCLSELNDNSLVEEVQRYLQMGKGSRGNLSLSQLSALAFALLMSEQDLMQFKLKDYGGRGSPARSDAGLLRMLPVVKASTKAVLHSCNLTESSWVALASVLRAKSCCVKDLNLSGNKVLDSGVELLCTGLEHPNCRLERLELWACDLTENSCAALSSALSSNSSSLRDLNLNGNELQDSGVELLSTGLKHPNCKLEILELWECKLSESSCAFLASALCSKSTSLRKLNLKNNKLRDAGVKQLYSALEHPNCKLETLELQGCRLTQESCASLASALLSDTSSLKMLSLSSNNLLDSGVELLSAALGHPNCKLEKLKLQSCHLTERSCECLASALSSQSSSMRKLNLRWNNLEQSAAFLPLLQDPNSKLESAKL
ncbi:NACHT, LRR and PYD domains-containing protein 12-like [Clupea harengus]|uniref:NACHT, LRR and PYD domains-containing protein 12-like n=1 Tax=Clupea harengus TaxID=7950 RepID=A0A6P8F380_CLUHA|nr:NACHT, LRR and PYD domains-containing protein 12-like [Clupea harengus]